MKNVLPLPRPEILHCDGTTDQKNSETWWKGKQGSIADGFSPEQNQFPHRFCQQIPASAGASHHTSRKSRALNFQRQINACRRKKSNLCVITSPANTYSFCWELAFSKVVMKLLMQDKWIKWRQSDNFHAVLSLILPSCGALMFIYLDYKSCLAEKRQTLLCKPQPLLPEVRSLHFERASRNK